MISAVVPVLAASLVGSVHCAAMCGSFACVTANDALSRGNRQHPFRSAVQSHAMYNGGRLIAYALLGAVAGQLGMQVTHMASWIGVARGATIVTGVLMVLWGLDHIASANGLRTRVVSVPLAWQRAIGGLLSTTRSWSPALRAGMTGLLTGLIPCGWLYVFVVTAAAAGSPQAGAVMMTIFWLGTVPALVVVGAGAQRLLAPLRVRLPQLSATVVLVMGLLAVSGRMTFSHAH